MTWNYDYIREYGASFAWCAVPCLHLKAVIAPCFLSLAKDIHFVADKGYTYNYDVSCFSSG